MRELLVIFTTVFLAELGRLQAVDGEGELHPGDLRVLALAQQIEIRRDAVRLLAVGELGIEGFARSDSRPAAQAQNPAARRSGPVPVTQHTEGARMCLALPLAS